MVQTSLQRVKHIFSKSNITLFVLFSILFILLSSIIRTLVTPNTHSGSYLTPSHDTNQTIALPGLQQEIASSITPSTEKVATEITSTTQRTPTTNTITPPTTTKAVINTPSWQYVTAKPGDSMAAIFQRVGLSSKTLQIIMQHNPHAQQITRIIPNQRLAFLIENQSLEKMTIPLKNGQTLHIERDGARYITQMTSPKVTTQNQLATATVQGSLFNTAKRRNIPYKLIQQMTSIFDWEINFARDVRAGDQFTILYKADYIGNQLVKTGDILAVTYTTRGKTHRAIRHERPHGDIGYYTPEGASLKKGFARYPLQFKHISSMFSLARMHPLLHYKRPHYGVDLAAPTGTPIHATGDGRIIAIDRHHAYGNMVKIAHHSSYVSLYAHLLRFQKGLSQGDWVKRGQIIGYVGQTGLADGPHCHYEFHINHTPKNPSTITLPQAEPIRRHELSSFKQRASQLLTQIKRYETAQFSTPKKSTRKIT